MANKSIVIKHNLHDLSEPEKVQYLREVSEFIGLDPDLNGLDLIWMENETGPGRSLVVYARRGTAEILRNLYGVEVETLTYAQVNGSIVFTATGRASQRNNRQEIAIGSKYIGGLTGKALDDAIMTASTRALRRLTMQFTTLGILDESEVVAVIGQQANPAGSAQLAPGGNIPPAYLPPPAVPANNAPGKLVEATHINHDTNTVTHEIAPPAAPVSLGEPFTGQSDQIAAAWAQHDAAQSAKISAKADIKPDTTSTPAPATPLESTTSASPEPDTKADTSAKPKRKKKNTVALDVEPETVTRPVAPPSAAPAPAPAAVPPQANPVVPPQANPASAASAPAPAAAPVVGMPTEAQMAEYRKKIAVYTAELPASANLGSTQKMRAFITKMANPPTPPQQMTVAQWEEVLAWFDKYMSENGNRMKSLVKYINDSLGVQ